MNNKDKDNDIVLHLYLLDKCTHHCPDCCNKLYDISKLENVSVELLSKAKTICFTGGEPFYVNGIDKLACRIKIQYPNIEHIYAYTAGEMFYKYLNSGRTLNYIDGVSIAPKSLYDMKCMNNAFIEYKDVLQRLKSNRIMLFNNMNDLFDETCVNDYDNVMILGRNWDKKFSTPINEIFCRLPILY